MKGQLIFEFIVASLIFFAIIMYTINYLNVNISDFREKFYQNKLQNKAFQISEILMSGQTSLNIADNGIFNQTRINLFNSTYCGDANYKKLVDILFMYETTNFGVLPNNVNIELDVQSTGVVLLDCGPGIPRGVAKAEIGRVGLFQGSVGKLGITVW